MVTSEAVPFAKAGGLADAVSALAETLAVRGHEVSLLLPRYYFIDRDALTPTGVSIGPLGHTAHLYRTTLPTAGGGRNGASAPEPCVYFLDCETLYGRDGIYGTREEPVFADNSRRFAVLSRAAFSLIDALGLHIDLIHAHDWPSGPVPVYRDALVENHRFGREHPGATLFTIHNAGYQGIFPRDRDADLGLSPEELDQIGAYHFDSVSFLKGAIRTADAISTVSETHAQELQTPEGGFGLDVLYRLRAQDLFGVLNGMDYNSWNPARDPHLPVRFGQNSIEGKAEAKRALQAETGLPLDTGVPLFGMIGRLVEQKGIEELLRPGYGVLEAMAAELPLQFVVLGTGESWAEAELRRLCERYPNVSAVLSFDSGLAHRIEAGCDFFLMPSRYEPCGLNQMYSLSYGTIPIVTATGGLRDTIRPLERDPENGTGLVMEHCTPWDIHAAVTRAIHLYREEPAWIRQARLRGMRERFDWDNAAATYEQIYAHALDRRRSRLSASV